MSSFLFIELTIGGLGWLLGAVLLFLLPFNLLLFEVMNLLFLWFPTRMTPTTAGDFQMMGRQALLFFAIFFIVFLLAGIPATIGWLIHASTNAGPVVAAAISWVLLAGVVLAMLPLVARAFRHFDVARDTPP